MIRNELTAEELDQLEKRAASRFPLIAGSELLRLVAMARRGMELVSFSEAMHKASEDHRKAVNHFMNQNPDDQ